MRRRYLYPFTVILLLGIAVTAVAIKSHNDAGQSANLMVTQVSSVVLANWDPALIINNAHVSLLEVSDADFYQVYFNALSRLGSLQNLNNGLFTLDLPPLWRFWTTDSGTASYAITAQFSNGEADITIKLLREDNRWWFTEYMVLTALMAE